MGSRVGQGDVCVSVALRYVAMCISAEQNAEPGQAGWTSISEEHSSRREHPSSGSVWCIDIQSDRLQAGFREEGQIDGDWRLGGHGRTSI